LELEDTVPDAKTLWLYREALAKAGAVGAIDTFYDRILFVPRVLNRRSQTRRTAMVNEDRMRGEVYLQFPVAGNSDL
jgi:IS5 family transposase